jgi:hypothetical protein
MDDKYIYDLMKVMINFLKIQCLIHFFCKLVWDLNLLHPNMNIYDGQRPCPCLLIIQAGYSAVNALILSSCCFSSDVTSK